MKFLLASPSFKVNEYQVSMITNYIKLNKASALPNLYIESSKSECIKGKLAEVLNKNW